MALLQACPCLFHPTRIAVIGEPSPIAQALERLQPSLLLLRFPTVRHALAELSRPPRPQRPGTGLLTDHTHQVGLPELAHVIGIDLSAIHLTVFDRWRFETLSTVVITTPPRDRDYQHLREVLTDTPVIRLALLETGKQLPETAAHDTRLMVHYLDDRSAGIQGFLATLLRTAQKEYFRWSTIPTLACTPPAVSPCWLEDPAFAEWLFAYLERERFIEYYLLPHPMGLLMVDADGRCARMIVQTQEDMRVQLEIAQDEGAPTELLQALTDGQRVAAFDTPDGHYRRGLTDWRRALLPAECLKGREPYYWAVTREPPGFTETATPKIHGLNEFLGRSASQRETQ